MGKAKSKAAVDVLLAAGLILLMSYRVVGDEGHEWTGIAMAVLMLLHQALNRRWYAALFRGRYSPLRCVQTAVDLALLLCFAATVLCGVNMSVYAVPALSEFMKASTGRVLHLALSHWSFVLMGLHLGLHMPAMLRKVKKKGVRRAFFALSIPAAGAGAYFFLRGGYPECLAFRRHFVFIDYDGPAVAVLAQALLIVFFLAFLGMQLQRLLARGTKKGAAALGAALALAVGTALFFAFPASSPDGWNASAAFPDGGAAPKASPAPADAGEAKPAQDGPRDVDDGFIPIPGGSFLTARPDRAVRLA